MIIEDCVKVAIIRCSGSKMLITSVAVWFNLRSLLCDCCNLLVKSTTPWSLTPYGKASIAFVVYRGYRLHVIIYSILAFVHSLLESIANRGIR